MDTSDLYRDVTDFAHSTPGWVQSVAELWTEAGLLLFGVLFVALWWRARAGSVAALALAVLAPLATGFGYVVSELLKSAVHEDRPCRAVAGALAPLVACPPPGDWSFPSNHSAIAGAAAVGLALAARGAGAAAGLPGRGPLQGNALALLVVPMALLMAFSRVFVGVHYPHDVAMGLILGASVASLVMALGARPLGGVLASMRGSGSGAARWLTGPGPARRP